MWLTFDGFSSEPMRNEFVWRGVGRTVGEPSRPGVSASRAKAGCLCLSKHRGLPPFSKGGLQQRGADAQRRREDQGSPHGYHPGHHRRWKQRSTRNHCLTNLSITPSVGMSPVGLSAFGDSSGPTFPDRRGDLCGTLREKGPSPNVPITALAFCRKRTEMGAKGPEYSRGHSPLTSWT